MRFPFPAKATVGRSIGALICGAAITAGCGSGEAGTTDAEASAVVTTTQVADLVSNVGGDRLAVHRLLAPGADPHDYEPRPSDAEAVAEAAVVFRSGGDLDEWLDAVVENAGGGAEVVTLMEAAESVEREQRSHGRDEPAIEDPHWWQDPRNAIAAVDAIGEALVAADPGGAPTYRANARAYAQRLRRLDEEIARCMGQVPAEQRKLVTTHDSYGYFAERYDVEVVGALIPSRSSQAQPSAGATAELVEQIEQEGVNAVFPESPLNPKLEQAVAGETGAEVADPLWADSLGPEGSAGATYIDALASDTEAMVDGFTGGERSCRPAA